MKILAVDNDSGCLNKLSKALMRSGHQVTRHKDYKSALETAFSQKPHLVLLGINESDPNAGFDFIRSLKTGSETKNVTVFALCDRNNTSLIEKAFIAGADDYLIKPLPYKSLAAVIHFRTRNMTQKVHSRSSTKRPYSGSTVKYKQGKSIIPHFGFVRRQKIKRIVILSVLLLTVVFMVHFLTNAYQKLIIEQSKIEESVDIDVNMQQQMLQQDEMKMMEQELQRLYKQQKTLESKLKELSK